MSMPQRSIEIRHNRAGSVPASDEKLMSTLVADTVQTTPSAALAAVASYEGPLVVDLDETLYLRNSTEDFIDSARPGLAALLLLRLLDLLQPWRWTGGEATRDVWRVRAVLLLLPWTAARWRRRVVDLAAAFTNRPLLDALRRQPAAPLVATLGFRPIVAPLLAAMGLGDLPLVAVSAQGFDDRRRGKLAMVQQAIGAGAVQRALVVTDSPEDTALLASCARPLHVVWPAARYRRALQGVYLPGQYLGQVKRPGERYIVRSILQEDYAYWLLASIGLAAVPVLHGLGLLFLLLSFWTIYELGYVDNDVAAERYEKAPNLSAAYHQHPVATPTWSPWAWAFGAATIGIALLRWPAAPLPVDFAKWLAVLLTTFVWFRIYNRYDKSTRVWLFAGLQFARVAAFTVLVPVAPIGAVALAAHAMSRWVPYHTYRASGGNWPDTRPQAMRLLFFVVLAALLAITQGHGAVLNWTALALLGWSLFRARRDLAHIRAAASRIDRPAVEATG
jgi:hypothetical protein